MKQLPKRKAKTGMQTRRRAVGERGRVSDAAAVQPAPPLVALANCVEEIKHMARDVAYFRSNLHRNAAPEALRREDIETIDAEIAAILKRWEET